MGRALHAGLTAMGLELHAQPGHRLNVLTSVRIPAEVNDVRVRQALLNEFNVEIGGGLGQLKGKIWRIGLMGHSCTRKQRAAAAARSGEGAGEGGLQDGGGGRGGGGERGAEERSVA